MEFLNDFLEKENLRDTKLFNLLSCNEHEALIIKKMIILMLNGEGELNVTEFLKRSFNVSSYETLPYIREIANLINLGYLIVRCPFKNVLSLLQNSISLHRNIISLLEVGDISNINIKSKEYNDVFSYLEDEFLRLDLLALTNSDSILLNSKLNSLVNKKIEDATLIIQENLEKTNKKFNILNILKKYKLNEDEKDIFFYILRYQYKNNSGLFLRDLLDSVNKLKRIKIQKLLNKNSNLFEHELIAIREDIGAEMFLYQELYIPYEIYNHIMEYKIKINLKNEVKNSDLFDMFTPENSFDDLILNSDIKNRLNILISHSNPKVHKKLKSWGITKSDQVNAKILFFGDSGTGKTSSAKALAKSLKRDILNLDCSRILSMYVGESEKNVKRIFDEYNDIAHKTKLSPILLFDEADQLLGSRGYNENGVAKMYNQMQNIFLEQIEKFDGMLIAVTNLLDSFDTAFSRRFGYKILFTRPEFEARTRIWNLHLSKNMKFKEKREDIINKLSKYDLSGGQIKIIIENTAYKVATQKEEIFSLNDFEEEVEKEKRGDFSSNKKMGFAK